MHDHSWKHASRRAFVGGGLALGATALVARNAFAQEKAKAPATPATPGAPAKPATPAAPGKAAPPAGAATATPTEGAIVLPPLPYAQNALEPVISATTLATHHGKHHKAYVDKTNELVQGTKLAGKPLEDIIKASAKNKAQAKLFNNSAQVWNHSFYWQSMRPKGGGAPTGDLATRIDKDFGSYDQFKTQFVQTATEHFSNGWVWLVLEKNKLKIIDTHDADTALIKPGVKPLAVSDVWEHAYYLDYKNVRKEYATAWVEKLLNWEFVAQNLGA